MKYVIILIAISFLMACQKEQFQPCEDYDKLVGTWRSIDGDAVDIIEITEGGKYTRYSALERNAVYKLDYCEKKMLTSGKVINGVHFIEYFYFRVEKPKDGSLVVLFNSTFDTIIGGNGAFNHDDSDLEYERRFVKQD